MPTMRTLYAFIASAGVARADQRNFWADSATCEGSAMYAGPVVQVDTIENHQLNEVTYCERSVETVHPLYSNSFVLGDSATGSQPHRRQVLPVANPTQRAHSRLAHRTREHLRER